MRLSSYEFLSQRLETLFHCIQIRVYMYMWVVEVFKNIHFHNFPINFWKSGKNWNIISSVIYVPIFADFIQDCLDAVIILNSLVAIKQRRRKTYYMVRKVPIESEWWENRSPTKRWKMLFSHHWYAYHPEFVQKSKIIYYNEPRPSMKYKSLSRPLLGHESTTFLNDILYNDF